MKKRTVVLMAMLLPIALGACSLLGGPIAEKVADVIDDYCTEPFGARQLYRETVNQELAAEGHSIQVQCAGDPDEVTSYDRQMSPAAEPADELVAAVLAYCETPGVSAWSTRHDVAVRCRDPGGRGRGEGG